MNETITWIETKRDTPDEGIVVLVYVPNSPDVVWPGYLEDGCWIFSNGAPVDSEVTYWAEFPSGPVVPAVNPARCDQRGCVGSLVVGFTERE